jgi:hypothetical protein
VGGGGGGRERAEEVFMERLMGRTLRKPPKLRVQKLKGSSRKPSNVMPLLLSMRVWD